MSVVYLITIFFVGIFCIQCFCNLVDLLNIKINSFVFIQFRIGTSFILRCKFYWHSYLLM